MFPTNPSRTEIPGNGLPSNASLDTLLIREELDSPNGCPVIVDGSTITGNGTIDAPLSATVGGNAQAFRYTAVGGDGAAIVVNLPAPRASVNYNVMVTQGDVANLLACAAPPTLYALGHFTLKLSAAPTVGDTFLFLVEDIAP